MEKDNVTQPAKKQRVTKQMTLFECMAVNKICFDKKGREVRTDFCDDDVKMITGSVFHKRVPYTCKGCGSNFKKGKV